VSALVKLGSSGGVRPEQQFPLWHEWACQLRLCIQCVCVCVCVVGGGVITQQSLLISYKRSSGGTNLLGYEVLKVKLL